MQKLIGRENELSVLNSIYTSGKSEFVAIYGRRRVGKTFLIRSVFEEKFTFQITGLAKATLGQQLTNFHLAITKHDMAKDFLPAKDWLKAFSQLSDFLETKKGRKLVFIDELPWFDTRNSKFIQGLEHFWNSWASARSDIVLVVCGSATSWMINKLINDKGGLHNRITKKIKLAPFTLYECGKYLKSRKINLDRYQIIQLYMSLGGIPFYWDEVKPGQSAMQNIENICFSETGLLRNEFVNLYRSLFNNHERHLSLVNALAKKSKGLYRDELIKLSGLPNAGSTTRLLDELEESGFIRKYIPYGKKSRNSLYQLVDFYTHFYLKFMVNTQLMDKNNWLNVIDSPKYRAWSGYAFEQVCMCHQPQIKQALGISGVYTTVSSWRSSKPDMGAQVDLIIDRRDQVINLCEIKFSINPYTITKKYASELRNKIGAFKIETGTRKSVFLTMITTYGVQPNIHSIGLIQNELQMDDLFSPIP
ncbi:MAG: ATPase [Bacteroidetes bacterium]|nr:MAG: ATPase [Bacteroidota bacterium]